ncbi:unnamed protein product [Brassica rapa]|uniref:Uncharacterized protein n=1 Tax=Brassica campestris TaxID=3711 RepID=A0A8D9HXH2_BRACM|nr:unnamed protein product [Brassica rapa]
MFNNQKKKTRQVLAMNDQRVSSYQISPGDSEAQLDDLIREIEQKSLFYYEEKKKSLRAQSNVKADDQKEVIVSILLGYSDKLHQAQNSWHSDNWTFKFVLLVSAMVASFFIPQLYIQIYGTVMIFLGLQLISVIEFITWWNNYWMPNNQSRQR